MAAPQEFNNLQAMSQLVNILVDVVGDNLGKFVNPDTGVETSSPAIFLGRANNTAPNFPRIALTWQGSNDGQGHTLDSGSIEVDDPDNIGQTIEVPYTAKLLVYGVTLTCESGSFDTVLNDYAKSAVSATEQQRLSSEQILSKIRKSLLRDEVKKRINTQMNSSVRLINTIVPVPFVDETEYMDSSTMTIFFTTVDTELWYESGVFDTIQGMYTYYRDTEGNDPTPITGEIEVTSRLEP